MSEGLRICRLCKKSPPDIEFGPSRSQQWRCRKCLSLKAREWYVNNLDERKEYAKKLRQKWRLKMLKAYGNKCTCCGELEPNFLTLEHINRDGREHRRGRNPVTILREMRDAGWPKDRFTILCYNCNLSRGFYGECPHKRKMLEVA